MCVLNCLAVSPAPSRLLLRLGSFCLKQALASMSLYKPGSVCAPFTEGKHVKNYSTLFIIRKTRIWKNKIAVFVAKDQLSFGISTGQDS